MSGLPPGLWVFPGTAARSGTSPSTGVNDKNFEHVQNVPRETWTVVHNLNKYPAITVMSLDGQEVWCEVRHDSKQQITLDFSEPFAGIAVCN